ncbi:MAG: hypothetical protein M3N93_05325, partial [Acidobacteriota bacterium]|nr:hypothetical protein [Acidobacteriota bacterium]
MERTLQGNPPGLLVTAVLTPPMDPHFAFPNGVLTRDAIGQSGIWFLTQSAAGYQVMPLIHGPYVRNLDIYVPVSGTTLEGGPVQGTTNQQLLSYLIKSYIDVPNPCSWDDPVYA